MADWYSVTTPEQTARLLGAWPDAPIENEELCALILTVAREQVVEYGPALVATETVIDGYLTFSVVVPDRYIYAQLKQAENLWNAARVSSGGEVGVDQYSYTPRPLDKTIKGIIRPQVGGPRVR